jgi:hypothetical protein
VGALCPRPGSGARLFLVSGFQLSSSVKREHPTSSAYVQGCWEDPRAGSHCGKTAEIEQIPFSTCPAVLQMYQASSTSVFALALPSEVLGTLPLCPPSRLLPRPSSHPSLFP